MDKNSFTETLGWIFEHSPWVAERTWSKKPFASISDLHQVMKHIVNESTTEEKLALVRAHPVLATRQRMAEASVEEQSGAGLNQLSKEEFEDFQQLNQAYFDKFQFPFIMAVKGQNKDTIRAAMRERLQLSPEKELEEALQQIYKIARFRLEDLIIE